MQAGELEVWRSASIGRHPALTLGSPDRQPFRPLWCPARGRQRESVRQGRGWLHNRTQAVVVPDSARFEGTQHSGR